MGKGGYNSNSVKIWTRLVNTVCIIVILVCFVIIVMPGTAVRLYFGGSVSESAAVSTEKRQALPAGSVNETAYYSEDAFLEDKIVIEKGLKHFYQVTGVQPYVEVIGSLNGNDNPTVRDIAAYARPLYSQLFTDESHLLLVFFFDFKHHDFKYYFVAGSKAKTVIDSEAEKIIAGFLRYYFDDLSISEEMFSNAFSDAGDRIMNITSSPSSAPVFIFLGAAVVLIVLLAIFISIRNKKKLRQQQNKEILNMPLEHYGAEPKGKEEAPVQNYGSASACSPSGSPAGPANVSFTGTVEAQEEHIKRLVNENSAEIEKYTDLAKQALSAGKENDARIFIVKKQQLESVCDALNAAHANIVSMRQMHDNMTGEVRNVQPRQTINIKTTVARNGRIINQTSYSVGNQQSAPDLNLTDEMSRMLEHANSILAGLGSKPIFETQAHGGGPSPQYADLENLRQNGVPKDDAEILAEKYAAKGSEPNRGNTQNSEAAGSARERCAKQRKLSADEELAGMKADMGL